MQLDTNIAYKLITGIIGILIGSHLIFNRKKIIAAQKRMAGGRTDFIYGRLATRADNSAYLLAIVVGICFILLSVIQLLSIRS